jgi:hypothetical protein
MLDRGLRVEPSASRGVGTKKRPSMEALIEDTLANWVRAAWAASSSSYEERNDDTRNATSDFADLYTTPIVESPTQSQRRVSSFVCGCIKCRDEVRAMTVKGGTALCTTHCGKRQHKSKG